MGTKDAYQYDYLDDAEQYRTVEDGKEKFRMCKAIEDLIMDGRLESKVEDILELLGELGEIPAQMEERIRAETDLSTLSSWHKAAAKARRIEEFHL